MAELIREHSTSVVGEDGTTYVVRIWADERADGTWEGWLEFDPKDRSRALLRTERETSQPNRAAVDYWATGLEPVYLDGAFARARPAAAAARSRVALFAVSRGPWAGFGRPTARRLRRRRPP